MVAQLGETQAIIAEFHISGVPTSGLTPAPTIDVIAPNGTVLVNDGAMTEQASAARYVYNYTYPGVAGVYTFRVSCAASGLDDPEQRIAVEAGQDWIENLDIQISTRSALAAADVWNYVISNGKTAAQIMRGFIAALLGKVNGAGGTTIRFRNMADDTDVITATVDSSGNRSAVTLDLDD